MVYTSGSSRQIVPTLGPKSTNIACIGLSGSRENFVEGCRAGRGNYGRIMWGLSVHRHGGSIWGIHRHQLASRQFGAWTTCKNEKNPKP